MRIKAHLSKATLTKSCDHMWRVKLIVRPVYGPSGDFFVKLDFFICSKWTGNSLFFLFSPKNSQVIGGEEKSENVRASLFRQVFSSFLWKRDIELSERLWLIISLDCAATSWKWYRPGRASKSSHQESHQLRGAIPLKIVFKKCLLWSNYKKNWNLRNVILAGNLKYLLRIKYKFRHFRQLFWTKFIDCCFTKPIICKMSFRQGDLKFWKQGE